MLSEMVPGPTTASFAELADSLKVFIAFGLITRQSGILLIAANNWGSGQSICFSGESAVIFSDCGPLAG